MKQLLLSFLITPEDLEHYDGANWRTLSRSIRNRDNWQCRQCGSRRHLHVHHRWPWHAARRHGWLAFRIANMPIMLITLCNACHEQVHSRDLNRDGVVGHAKTGEIVKTWTE